LGSFHLGRPDRRRQPGRVQDERAAGTARRLQVALQHRFALTALRRHLTAEGDFSITAIGRILDYVRSEGVIDGAPFIRFEEVDELTDAYIDEFPAVPYDSREWDADPSNWGSTDVLDYDDNYPDAPDWSWAGRGDDVTLLPPIAGGAHFEPSESDWESYRSWADAVDRIDECNDCRDSETPA
jgi:hypothetical protein